MILIGVGANQPFRPFRCPRGTLEAALVELGRVGVSLTRRSRWYRSAPVPPSEQPWFVNGVIAVCSKHSPSELLACMHDIEHRFGRTRGIPGGPRTLDLDLLTYDDRIRASGDGGPALPHPRLAARAFVLHPLREVAPRWRHPESGRTVDDLLATLPAKQIALPMLSFDGLRCET